MTSEVSKETYLDPLVDSLEREGRGNNESLGWLIPVLTQCCLAGRGP